MDDLITRTTLANVSLPDSEQERERLTRSIETYYLTFLKNNLTPDGISLFDDLVIEEISKLNGFPKQDMVDRVKKARKLESNPALIVGGDFPTLHAQAKKNVLEELKSRTQNPEMQLIFLVEQLVLKAKKELERDYKFAEPLLGKNDAEMFASCMLELRFLATAPTINIGLMKNRIIRSLQTGEPIELIHIKSLRYTYPKAKGLDILQDTSEEISTGIGNEKRKYPNEDIIFQRLATLRALLSYYKVPSNLTVIVADKDLNYLFPDDSTLISSATLEEAKKAARVYVNFLQEKYTPIAAVDTLTGYLQEVGKLVEYETICREALNEAKRGGGKLVPEKILELRVDYQYEHYREMFGNKYTRQLARYTASYQIASLTALSALFESFSTVPTVVIDGRGFETALVGSHNPASRAIYLTRLKDPVEVLQ